MDTPPTTDGHSKRDLRPLQKALKILLDINPDFSVSRLLTFLYIADRSEQMSNTWPPDPQNGWVPQTEVLEALGLSYSTMSAHAQNLASRGRKRSLGVRTAPMGLIEITKMDEHLGRNLVRPTAKGRALFKQITEALHA